MTSHAQLAGWEPRYAARAERMRASEIRELLKLLEQPGIISFAGGIPDPALFPVAEARAAYAAVLADAALAGSGLQYSVSEGYLPLRQWIVRHMGDLGVACAEDNIVVTSGSQQALDFLGRLLLSPGDTALVTAPTYLGALQAFSAYEPRYDELRPEDGNRTPQSYAQAAAAAGARVKFAYVVPSYANPTGETLSLAARERLLDLAAELDIPDRRGCRLCRPALRGRRAAAHHGAGGCAARRHRQRALDLLRHVLQGAFAGPARGMDRGAAGHDPPPRAGQAGLRPQQFHHQPDGHAPPGGDGLRRPGGARPRALPAPPGRHAGGAGDAHAEGVTWTRPGGGLFVWLRLPDGMDGASLLDRAVKEAGVAFVPGAAFFHDDRGRNTLRLSYSLATEAEIEEGIARLAKLLT